MMAAAGQILKHRFSENINGLKIVCTTESLKSFVVFPAKAGNQFNNAWIPACAGMTKHEDKYETINNYSGVNL
jgi:hypothetical protein